ncbi:hypothetical protein LCGC14_3128330 [marine sediment metagenome]|uniref:Uncharacterized protein n=1 Tax=marine sediment metagenome TaxID=412755 RepID=A0A0F8Y7H9_9ZZZZ
MATGRTVDRWLRFAIDDSSGTPREIPINTISPVGLVYDETELTAFQDVVKGYLAMHPDAPLDVTGPWGNLTAAALAASGAAPVLSGAHTILNAISAPTFTTPLGLAVMYGIRGYWTSGDPVFGVVAPSATSGYVCTKYQVEGDGIYSARFVPFAGTTPAWGTAILT